MNDRKRKPVCYQIQNGPPLKKTWSDYFNDIAQEYQGGNCTCARCVTEALKKSEDREKVRAHMNSNSSEDLPEGSLSVYSFGKDDDPAGCTCIFCSTYSYTIASCEEVLKDKVTKLGKENIPSCKAKMLHPERKFFRYASLREKRMARAKNEPGYGSEYSIRSYLEDDDIADGEKQQETDEWSMN